MILNLLFDLVHICSKKLNRHSSCFAAADAK